MNLGLSLLDLSLANGQEEPAEPVQQFQSINKQSKGNEGRYYFMTAITVFSPRGDFSQADIKSQVSIIGDEFKAMKQSPWALEMFMVSGR